MNSVTTILEKETEAERPLMVQPHYVRGLGHLGLNEAVSTLCRRTESVGFFLFREGLSPIFKVLEVPAASERDLRWEALPKSATWEPLSVWGCVRCASISFFAWSGRLSQCCSLLSPSPPRPHRSGRVSSHH